MIKTRERELYEIFEEASQKGKIADRAAILKEYDSLPLKHILQVTFDPHIKWEIPTDSPPPYKPTSEKSVPTSLRRQTMKLTMFLAGNGTDNLNQSIRESRFIQLLEGIHPKDAEMLVGSLTGNFPYKKITRRVVDSAFPGLLRNK